MMKKLIVVAVLAVVMAMGLGSSLAAAANPETDPSNAPVTVADLKWSGKIGHLLS